MNSFKRGLTHYSIYFSGNVLGKIIPFIALPFITRIVPKEAYGQWSLLYTLIAFLLPITSLMTRHYISAQFYKQEDVQTQRDISASFILFFLTTAALLLSLSALFIFKLIPKEYLNVCLFLVPLACLFINIKDISSLIARFKEEPLSHTLLEVGFTALFYLLMIVTPLILGRDWTSLVWAYSLAAFLILIPSYYYLKKYRFNFTRKNYNKLMPIFIYSAPFIPHALGSAVINLSDRYVIGYFQGLEAVGSYSIIYPIGTSLALLTISFNKVWSPWIYKQISQAQVELVKVVKSVYLFIAGLMLLSIAYYFPAKYYIIHAFAPEYRETIALLPYLILASFFQGAAFALFPIINNTGKTIFFTYTTSIASVINLILTIYWVPRLGIIGAAYSTLVSNAFSFVAGITFCALKTKLPFLGGWR